MVKFAPDAAGGGCTCCTGENVLGRRKEAIGVLVNANAQIKRTSTEQEGDYFDYKLLGRICLARQDYNQVRTSFDRGGS